MKPTGTGSSRGPRTRGFGAQMFNSDECVRVEHFFGVPAESIFGGVKVRPRLFRSHTRTHATPARRVRRVQASLTGVRPLTWEYCSPSFPSGKPFPLSWKYCLPPSCGFPPKSFPLKRETHHFGGHLRHSGTRASEDGASTAPPCYAACNAPASRREWRIAGARFVSPRHSYGRRGAQEGSAL